MLIDTEVEENALIVSQLTRINAYPSSETGRISPQ
jgi:hypothetical protein